MHIVSILSDVSVQRWSIWGRNTCMYV